MGKQIAIVTGAGSGIGRAIATALAVDGYHVAMIGRNKERLAETLEIIERGQGVGSIYPGDITISAEVNKIFKEIASVDGEVQILVNNAGHLLVKPITETTETELRELLDVHVVATFCVPKKPCH